MPKGAFVLTHRRWGNILWKKNLGIIELRIQMLRPFKKAWKWNPASKAEIPTLRVVPWRIRFFDNVAPHKRPQPKVHWKQSFLLGELRWQHQQVFPETPAWSPFQKIKSTRLKFGWKTAKPSTNRKTEHETKREEMRQTH